MTLATARRARVFALLGNPNTGKSTVFNALTGLRARVGNYPGVTVERREARLSLPATGDSARAEPIVFFNPLQQRDFTQTVYIARTGSRVSA